MIPNQCEFILAWNCFKLQHIPHKFVRTNAYTTSPLTTGITWVTPSPESITVPVSVLSPTWREVHDAARANTACQTTTKYRIKTERKLWVCFNHKCDKHFISCLLMPWGLRVPICKTNFCSQVLLLSKLPRWRERLQTAIQCLEWSGRFKCLVTSLDASLSFLTISWGCSQNRMLSCLLV